MNVESRYATGIAFGGLIALAAERTSGAAKSGVKNSQ